MLFDICRYVLFEWDTYLSGWAATLLDPWLATSQLIRMTKSGFVADSVNGGGGVIGFWNGHCGEADKSKPPVGGMLLRHLLKTHLKNISMSPNSVNNSWIAEIVMDQFMMWSRWWVNSRFQIEHGTKSNHSISTSLYAPGSTRQLLDKKHPVVCISQPPIGAARCETGLDNSPLYDNAKFVDSSNTIDQTDVGMSALVAADALALAEVSSTLAETSRDIATIHKYAAFAMEFTERGNNISHAIQQLMWDSTNSAYFNRNWTQGGWAIPQTVSPTTFYPLIAGIPSDEQVEYICLFSNE